MKHTPEPWEFTPDSIIAGEVCIANLETDGGYEADPETIDANGERIVSCVNAMAGIEDPAEALRAAREAIQHMLDRAAIWLGTPEDVESQRKMQDALALLTPKP